VCRGNLKRQVKKVWVFDGCGRTKVFFQSDHVPVEIVVSGKVKERVAEQRQKRIVR
jgi:hypothetical protein